MGIMKASNVKTQKQKIWWPIMAKKKKNERIVNNEESIKKPDFYSKQKERQG